MRKEVREKETSLDEDSNPSSVHWSEVAWYYKFLEQDFVKTDTQLTVQ